MGLVCVGKIKSPKGLQGEVHAHFRSDPAEWAEPGAIFLVDPGGRTQSPPENPINPKSLTLKRISGKGSAWILAFEGVGDRTSAEALVGGFIYVDQNLFKSQKGEVIFLSEILNFQVYDQNELVGKIESFSSNGPQDLLVVERGGRRIEIPFVEAFLLNVDFESQRVDMELPFGLWQETDE